MEEILESINGVKFMLLCIQTSMLVAHVAMLISVMRLFKMIGGGKDG